MSDNRGKDDNFIGKKTGRKRKGSTKYEKEFDLKKFKDKIFAELANTAYTQ
jgi:hypothetical protein